MHCIAVTAVLDFHFHVVMQRAGGQQVHAKEEYSSGTACARRPGS
jgi:hypothetical protein